MHRFTKDHVKRLARAISGVVMSHQSRAELAGLVAGLLEETGPKPTEKRPNPPGQFTARERRGFEEAANPPLGVEIVASVSLSEEGEVIYEAWAVWDWRPEGLVTHEVRSFGEAVEWVRRERMRFDPSQVPVRIERF